MTPLLIVSLLLIAGVLAAFGMFKDRLRTLAGVAPRPAWARVEVLDRANVGPRQGVAVVRIGERVLAVSVGDGGVRTLADLEEPIETPAPIQLVPDASVARQRIRHLRPLALILGIMGSAAVEPMMAPFSDAHALAAATVAQQADASPGAAETAAPAVDLDALARALGIEGVEAEAPLRLEGPVGIVVFMGLLAVLPTLVLLMTSFTRILVVLHFLRQALGTQTAPPGHLLAALAMLLTAFVMAPTLDTVNRTAVRPWMDGEIEQAEMIGLAQLPFRDFMLRQVRESDVARMVELSAPGQPLPESIDEVALPALVSAFVTSELRSAFQIGFALYLPFVVLDVVAASILMSMGMFMLPPVMVSLPLKLLLFVLVDGWGLVVEGLVSSFR